MRRYRLVLYAGNSLPETATVERDHEPRIGETIPHDGHQWRVRGQHIPADKDEPERDAYDVELID